MSFDCWEAGTIRIPAREWAGLKKSVREAALSHRASIEEQLTAAVAWLNANPARFRADDISSAASAFDLHVGKWSTESIEKDVLLDGLKKLAHPAKAGKFYQLTQKVLDALVGKAPTNKTVTFGDTAYAEWTIHFNNAAKAVAWNVPENNHAVEDAHEHPIAFAFFKALDKVPFGAHKHLGGAIVGNDEYHRELADAGDYYVSWRFGQAGKLY